MTARGSGLNDNRVRGPTHVQSVDALRGLLAFGIMVFHSFMWTTVYRSAYAEKFLHWLGIYGVEMFFVVSGFSMFFAYGSKDFAKRAAILDFAWKRFVRLLPLYVAAVVIAICYKVLIKHDRSDLSATNIVLNLTLLFGILPDPRFSKSLIIGGWSIGVEMVMYLQFPVLVWTWHKRRSAFWALNLVLVALGLFFAFSALSPTTDLGLQSTTYINSLNHAWFFASGMTIAIYRSEILKYLASSRLANALLVATIIVLLLAIHFFSHSEIESVTGASRIVFFALSFVICIIVSSIELPNGTPSKALSRLGGLSYSVYLLHPFVLQGLLFANARLHGRLPALFMVLSTYALTVLLSGVVYDRFELPSMNWGKRKAKEWIAQGKFG